LLTTAQPPFGPVTSGYGGRTAQDIRATAYADRPAPKVGFRPAGLTTIVGRHPNRPLEVTMSTLSIARRPTSLVAAAAAVAAVAAGTVAVSVSHHAEHPSAPADQPLSSVQQPAPRTHHHLDARVGGGRIMLGQ
jgi:hypothetical protein